MNLIRYDSIECSQSPWNGTKPRRVNTTWLQFFVLRQLTLDIIWGKDRLQGHPGPVCGATSQRSRLDLRTHPTLHLKHLPISNCKFSPMQALNPYQSDLTLGSQDLWAIRCLGTSMHFPFFRGAIEDKSYTLSAPQHLWKLSSLNTAEAMNQSEAVTVVASPCRICLSRNDGPLQSDHLVNEVLDVHQRSLPCMHLLLKGFAKGTSQAWQKTKA